MRVADLRAWTLPLIPLSIVVLLFEVLVRLTVIPSYLVPAPSEVLFVFFEESGDLWTAFGETLFAAAVGFVLSSVSGMLLGILLSSARWIRDALLPYATFFQTVPIIAIAPLLVIWIGYGMPTVIASSFIVAIFPTIASTLSGIQSTEPALLDLFRLYQANWLKTMWRLRLPFALPQILVGLKIASGLAVIGAIVGEFIAGGGLGGIIDVARTRQRVDQVFAALLMASLIGIGFLGTLNLLARYLLRHWHPSESRNK